jgi:hypothetical protein
MTKLAALFLAALTLPIWAGALAVVVGMGFSIFANFPIPMIVLAVALLYTAATQD